jgi:uncharacterized protein
MRLHHWAHVAAVALFAVLLLGGLATPAGAQEFPPRPDGPIYDASDLIPPAQEAAMDARLREFNQRTGNAVIVATVPSLGGENIENYATGLYETWGIGGAERDAGVLLLIAPNERMMRIEVGYGLTPYITDILSGRIIRNEITPRFKAGDMAGGVGAGVDAIVTQLEKSPEDAIAIAEAAAAAQKSGGAKAGSFVGGAIFLALFLLFFVLPIVFAARGGKRHRRSGMGNAVANIILWEALKAASGHKGGGWGGGGGGGFGGGGGGGFGGGGGGFGGFGGGMSGGGGASGGW